MCKQACSQMNLLDGPILDGESGTYHQTIQSHRSKPGLQIVPKTALDSYWQLMQGPIAIELSKACERVAL